MNIPIAILLGVAIGIVFCVSMDAAIDAVLWVFRKHKSR
mgnify:CR=1 FL=1